MNRWISPTLPFLAAGLVFLFLVEAASDRIMDQGQSRVCFLMALPGYFLIAGIIVCRRYRKPSFADLVLLVFGMPLVFISGIILLPYVHLLPRLPMNWGPVARIWSG